MQGSSLSLLVFVTLCFSLSSCEKVKIESQPAASLVVTTAVIGGGNVKLNTNERDSVKAYNAKTFGLVAGSGSITLFGTSSPAKPYFSATHESEPGGVYSIFLTGESAAVEAIFIKEMALPFYTDSTVGIRVINLSPYSSSFSINLASDTTVKVFSGVSYKAITEIMKFPLKSVIPAGTVTFQVRDDLSNTLLAMFTIPNAANSSYPNISTALSRNRNLTLVIKGMQGTTGTDGLGVFPVALY